MASKPTTRRKTPAQTGVAKVAPAAKSAKKAPGATPAGKSATNQAKPAGQSTAKSPSTTPTQKDPVAKVTTRKHKPEKKEKTVRDSFNMPADDYALIGTLKKRAIAAGREMKKSEMLRAGVKALAGMNDSAFAQALAVVAAIKTGRPARKRK